MRSSLWLPATFLLAMLVTGCTPRQPSPAEVREKTAEVTAAIKRDSKAIAQGVREGWNRDKPLDLNTATQEQLAALPGVNAPQAHRIVAARPYNDPKQLVAKRIMTQKEYDRIADMITVKK